MQVEDGAGVAATFHSSAYEQAGARIVDAKTALQSDILLKVRQPPDTEVPLFRDNSTIISFLYPAQNKPLIDKIAAKQMNAFGEFNFAATATGRLNENDFFSSEQQWIVFPVYHVPRCSTH